MTKRTPHNKIQLQAASYGIQTATRLDTTKLDVASGGAISHNITGQSFKQRTYAAPLNTHLHLQTNQQDGITISHVQGLKQGRDELLAGRFLRSSVLATTRIYPTAGPYIHLERQCHAAMHT
jgi:hypothetical protein